MKKELLEYSFIAFISGIILSIIALSLFIIFNQHLPNIKSIVFNGRTYYVIPDSIIHSYYIPGYILLIVSLIIYAIGIILLALSLFSKKKIEGNSRRRLLLISSLIISLFTVGLLLESIRNLISLKFFPHTPSITIQNYYFFGFNLIILSTIFGIAGIILSIIGLKLKDKLNEDQIQFITRKLSLKGDKLKSPFILIFITIILSFVSFLNFIIFNTAIANTNNIAYFEESMNIKATFILFNFIPTFFIITISLIIFLIGFIILVIRIGDQIKRDEQNIWRKKLLISSTIIIFLGFLILSIAYLRFFVFSIEISADFNNDLLNPGFLISPTAIYDYYYYGFIIFIISTILSIIGIIILGKGISSKSDINDKFSIIREQTVMKKRDNIKSSIILASMATAIYIGIFIAFMIFNSYVSNPSFKFSICDLGCLGLNSGISVPYSGVFFYYLPGFILYTISLILYITGIIRFIIGYNKTGNHTEKSRKNDMNTRILRLFFVAISIGTIISLIAYSRFVIFNGFLFPSVYILNAYFITNSQIQNLYSPGFNLFVISLGMYIIGMISLVVNKSLIGKKRN